MIGIFTAFFILVAFLVSRASGRSVSSFWNHDLTGEEPSHLPQSKLVPRMEYIATKNGAHVPPDPWLPSDYERASDGCVDLFEEEYKKSFLPSFDFEGSYRRLRYIKASFLRVSRELLSRIMDSEGERDVNRTVKEISEVMESLISDVDERRSGKWRY